MEEGRGDINDKFSGWEWWNGCWVEESGIFLEDWLGLGVVRGFWNWWLKRGNCGVDVRGYE